MTRSESVSTLPPWRRLLAMLNWRPVDDIEQRTKLYALYELNELESEMRILESSKRSKQLKNEIEQLETENKRLAELESRLDALLFAPTD